MKRTVLYPALFLIISLGCSISRGQAAASPYIESPPQDIPSTVNKDSANTEAQSSPVTSASSPAAGPSELVTEAYLMAFHACDTAGEADCHDPRNHMVYLAQSDDGANWNLIPGWEPFRGSVPDVIRRGDTLYIYTPGQLVRYHLDTNTIDPFTQVQVSDLDSGYVDPSLVIDDNGRLVLFFLYGQPGMDPAGCSPEETSCVRQIGSATEVAGSDGAEFTLDDGQRASLTIDPTSQIKSFSDPDIFFDGDQYVLYVSHGPSTSVWVSKELRGEYAQEPALPQGLLTNNTGGVPAGHFDMANAQYWTYAHININGKTVIRRAVHPDLFQQLDENDFDEVITGESIGLGASFVIASPGFAVNSPGNEPIYNEHARTIDEQPIPEFNPFENLTPEQENCLREAWGDSIFDDITAFKRPLSQDEEPAMGECLGFEPGGPGGPGVQPEGGGHAPTGDQVLYTTSSDGLQWGAGKLLAEAASVPDVIRTSTGEVWAYWVDFSEFTGPNMEKIGIARSRDDGATWEMLGNANFNGLGNIVPVDPDVIELPDGRFRMYFFDIAVRQLSHPIYSAISEDGINFTLEQGVRIWMDEIYDPDVIQLPDSSYRMYLNSGDILSANSPDGLTFTAEEGVRVENGSVPGSIVMPDGGIRMYNCAHGISVFESQDGLNFNLLKEGVIRDDSGTGRIICDPSITAIEEGYLIVYKTNRGQ
ncbi:MAG: hypothetical protein ISS57_02145 [Anaerolineales bacterium]|nr:hypothetical protein [Anaerolineales bacterium]